MHGQTRIVILDVYVQIVRFSCLGYPKCTEPWRTRL